jgi:phosphoglycerol transferase
MLIISTIILIFSIILIDRNKKQFILLLFFVFLFLIITNIYTISNYFTWKWIDESFIYHLSYWIEWAWLKSDTYIILIWVWLSILSIIIPLLIYKYLPKKKNNNKFKSIIALICIIIAFITHPFTKNILELNWYFIENKISDTNSNIVNTITWKTFQDIYKTPKQQKATLENKNIVFIYLESFENLYLNEKLFPWLSNWLNKIKKESTYFSNINQAYWTSRTIAWMVWSQCWIPLITSWWWWNSMHWMDSFLPWAFCMWDFLKNAWYNLNYIWWSKLSFAGKWNFYKTHWFNSVKWKDELIKNLKNKEYKYDWGLYDDTIFDLVYKEYDTLSKKQDKFWLFMLNLDTHWAKWVISKECGDLKYNDNENSILNSYHCTDYLLNNFINKIKQNDNFKDTIIVIASDHYAMSHNNSIDIIKKKEEERLMLFLIIGNYQKNKIISKRWTTLDIWPTTLSAMGFDVNNLGLWVNLLNNNIKTIEKEYNDFTFPKWKKEYESFWKYPSIKNWLTINIIDKKISFLEKSIEFPTLIHISNNIEIERILWPDKYSPTSLIQKIPEDFNSLYVDSCNKIDTSKKGTCILYTDSSWNKKINTVKNNTTISINTIKNILFNLKINSDYSNKKTILLNSNTKRYKEKIKRIAHAWWIYNWKKYTNSHNSLEKNKSSYNLFEIDFSWTKDNKLVCIHDWEWSFYNSFWLRLNWNIPTYKEFLYYIENNNKYKNCTLESLINWLKDNPEKYIVTDIKNKNINWLEYIAIQYPNYINRFIPQIYDPINYEKVKNIWYNNIIWTLYKYPENNNTIIYYLKEMELYAITMPLERVYNWLWNKIKDINNSIYTYTHTVNSYDILEKVKKMWIDNIYTDILKK